MVLAGLGEKGLNEPYHKKDIKISYFHDDVRWRWVQTTTTRIGVLAMHSAMHQCFNRHMNSLIYLN